MVYILGPHPVPRYSAAVALAALGVLLSFAVAPLMADRVPVISLVPFLILTCLLAGGRAGFVYLICSMAGLALYWGPRGLLYAPANRWAQILFFVSSIIVIGIVEYVQRHRLRLIGQLEEGEARFRGMIDSLPNLAWVTDENGKMLWFNEQWKIYTGIDPQALGTAGNAVHPDDLDRVTANWRQSFAKGQWWEDTFRIKRHDGVYHTFLSRARPIKDENGQIRIWVGTNTDVEEQLLRENQIARLNAELQWKVDEFDTLLRVIPVGIGVALDRDCRVIRTNPAFAEMLGLETGVNASLTASENEKPRSFKIFKDAVEIAPENLPVQVAAREGKTVKGDVVEILHADGRRMQLLQYATPLLDQQGNPRGAVAAFVDVSQRIAAEQRFKLLADHAPVMVWISDANRRCVYLNKPWLSFTGRTLEQEWGDGWMEALHPEDRLRCEHIYTTNFEARQPFMMEYRLRRHDGEYRWLMDQGLPLYEGPGGEFTGYIGSCVDITERRRLDAERAALLSAERGARHEAERVSRMKDEFLATLSHELRTPLNAIMGWVQILKQGPVETGDLEMALEVLERNAKAQSQLVEDLLDMSRIVSGGIRLEQRVVDLRKLVEMAVDSVRPAVEAKRLVMEMKLGADVQIMGDAARLQQVVWNLLTNAVKFTPEGGRIVVGLTLEEAKGLLSVEDSGQGIAQDFLPFVFDRFQQADGSTTRRHGGLGLGLAIVRNLVELHGGTVRAMSEGVGKGSRFEARIPVVEGVKIAAAKLLGMERKVEGALVGRSVLVVEDDADSRSLVERILADSGAHVTLAPDVEAALAALDGGSFDLLISDIGMPDRDGYELLREVRARSDGRAGIPALALTAFARPEDRQQAVAAGYNAHLPKPLDRTRLLSTVGMLLKKV